MAALQHILKTLAHAVQCCLAALKTASRQASKVAAQAQGCCDRIGRSMHERSDGAAASHAMRR